MTIGRSALPTEDQAESYVKETLGRDDVASGEMLEIGTYQGYLGLRTVTQNCLLVLWPLFSRSGCFHL